MATERPAGRRPGGRSERVRQAVAQAVLDLFAEGKVVVTHSEVAERAGVTRSTLYRRWPTRSALVEEALTFHTAHIDVPDTGSFAEDVFSLASKLAAFFADPTEIATSKALAMHADPDADNAQVDHWLTLMTDLAAPFRRAIERGDVQADANPLALLYVLVGPLVMFPLFLGNAPEPWFVNEVAFTVIRAAKPTPEVEQCALELLGPRRVMIDLPWRPFTQSTSVSSPAVKHDSAPESRP
ncbi:TetR/AcrR family transcriptional regulator [Nocardia gipuzkoensis]|uniref:TetR/AcrR family transcriptional regulator n=1 Tax=Nocardia gipuzkoensis TaxID=2749991 RepID=UPI0015EF1E5A|nr:TetR/AcrR family transcriptional regulator [Nocardia gipuzkoensis]